MSVKIEILDYKYGTDDNLVDVNAGQAGAGWTILSSGSAKWNGSGSGVTYLNNISSQSLIIGRVYNISLKITNYTGTGDFGFSISSGVTSSSRFDSNTNGVQHSTFIATNTSFPDLFGRSTNSGTISQIEITDASIIDWDNSIVGELDCTDHSDFPIAMTFQISDFNDFTSTSGDYSKTFKIPATKNNNNILKHLYISDSSVNNQITDPKSCRILFNNLYSLTGLLQVDGVGGYGETPAYYSCVFFGSNLSWANKIQDAFMNTIDWDGNGDNLEYKKPNIIATWQYEDYNNSAKSPIVYPITSYGDYNSSLGEQRTIQLLDTLGDFFTNLSPATYTGYYGYNNNGNEFGTPPPAADWRPSIFVKTTLEKIFSNVGYRIISEFMDTDIFKKLVWLLPNFKYNNPDARAIKYGYGNRFTNEGLIKTFTAETTSAGDKKVSEFYPDLNDAGADFILNPNRDNTGWDLATGIFTAQEYGYYNIQIKNFGAFYDNWVNSPNSSTVVDYAQLQLQVNTVGMTSWNTINQSKSGIPFYLNYGTPASYTGSISFTMSDINVYLNKGDKLRLKFVVKMESTGYILSTLDFNLFGSSTPISATQSTLANAIYNIELNASPVSYGQTYNLNDVINSDYKQIDFIKGVAHAFNLQMTTNENDKTITIEPFKDFYKPLGDAIDWTYKLDRSNDISDRWLGNELKRTLVFKYKSDSSDAKVKARGIQFFDGIEDEFPYKEILPDTFKKGDSTFENPFFAGTYNAKDMDTVGGSGAALIDTAFSACLWTEDAQAINIDRPVKGMDFLPRLLYWNKYSPVISGNVSTTKYATAQTWAFNYEDIFAYSNVSGNFLSNIYPQATMVNRDSTTSPVLSYGNVWVRDFNDDLATYSPVETAEGLYATYYKESIEMLKRNPRLRTVYIDLKISDIINLDFRKLVYIDGSYWRINKVVDFMPNKNKSTKVELIQWFDLGKFSPTIPSYGHSGSDFLNPGEEWIPPYTSQ